MTTDLCYIASIGMMLMLEVILLYEFCEISEKSVKEFNWYSLCILSQHEDYRFHKY